MNHNRKVYLFCFFRSTFQSVLLKQYDQIGLLLKVLGDKFTYNSSRLLGDFLGYFEKHHF